MKKKEMLSRGARRATWRSRVVIGIASAFGLAMTTGVFAQEVPTRPLTMIFKDVTDHHLFQQVIASVQSSKRVESFVMKKARRGWIEYEGHFFGDATLLVEQLQQAVQDKLKVELKPKDAGVEIFITRISF